VFFGIIFDPFPPDSSGYLCLSNRFGRSLALERLEAVVTVEQDFALSIGD
jgi:hypothetical protein